ncbi:hypothetical protein FGO68_gene8001 [Halteria grandinella]|uniref:Peptidase S11 D-alanyl-D-alanine carboxypeptidase A N-terminal domain-containing protein n=1 Tax=Halteria grandinella TaxID=5974 RepID=A0A8J8T068_HALGN|nr:hypothetical protein FGO68_gene8001 [Halteria grandinella]
MLVHKLLVDLAPPFVTAKSWAIMDGRTGEILFGKCENDRREIASLTKIMTAFVVIQIIRKIKLNSKKTLLQVSKNAASIGGTSAKLKSGDVLSVYDLLHGLMLPSGNDAATCLAEHFGQYLFEVATRHKNNKQQQQQNNQQQQQTAANNPSNPQPAAANPDQAAAQADNQRRMAPDQPIKYFIQEMNRYARALGLESTNYANPHGLSHKNNKSTAYDIGKLACIAMQDPMLREIVNKQSYECRGKDIYDEEREFEWTNTNKLLGKGFNGLKTGVTPAAGPCLAASFEKDSLHLVVVVMNTKTMDNRWVEVPKLTLWAINRLNKLCEYFAENQLPNGTIKNPA